MLPRTRYKAIKDRKRCDVSNIQVAGLRVPVHMSGSCQRFLGGDWGVVD